MKRREFCKLAVGTAAAMAAQPLWAKTPERPNIVMVVVDDMRFDEFSLGGHPYLETPNVDRIGREGAMFCRAYHAVPLCSPNRASILTGQYPSRHGILDNTSRSYASHRLDLFPKELQRAGYRTAHVGKWHMGNDPTPRPGYDYWVSFRGQGKTYDPDLYEDGRMHPVEGYITDIFTDRGIRFIENTGDQPFFLYIGHKAIHPEVNQLDDGRVDPDVKKEYIPSNRYRGRYESKIIERRPNYGLSSADRAGKPIISAAVDLKNSPAMVERFATFRDPGIAEESVRRRAEMMLSVDEGLGRILDALEERGILDDTLVIFTSDNGYFYGEHGLTIERRLPYEEAVRSPLVMRHPGLIPAGRAIDTHTLSIDLAPTVLDVAGADIPTYIQGKSLVPLFADKGRTLDRDAIMMEYYSHENPIPWMAKLDYRVILKGDYKYIRWLRYEAAEELYDLAADPYELANLAHTMPDAPRVEAALRDMRAELRRQVIGAMGI